MKRGGLSTVRFEVRIEKPRICICDLDYKEAQKWRRAFAETSLYLNVSVVAVP